MQAVIIIENGADNGEDHRVIGPFPDEEAASHWAFTTLRYGVSWYWLPLETPTADAIS